VDPYGNTVFAKTLTGVSDPVTATLPQSGTYALIVQGLAAPTAPVTYTFTAQRLGNIPPAPPAARR